MSRLLRRGAFLENGATLNVFNSTFEANLAQEGGGIYSAGTLRIEDSDIFNNRASGGAGIQSGFDVNRQTGSLRANRVTFRDNIASNPINPLLGTGGAFQIQSSNLNPTRQLAEFKNCTFSGNQANGTTDDGGGAIMVYDGTVTLENSTLSGNSSVTQGGGIRNLVGGTMGIVRLNNTIVAGNTASTSGPDLRGEIGSFNHNLIGSIAGATYTPASNDIIGQDPMLGPLANNGGPTQTRALLAGSPAIDAGFTVQTTDQRGLPRPVGTAPDIGAYEEQVGTIVIAKRTVPAGGVGFGFVITDTTGAAAPFLLNDMQAITLTNAVPGAYTVTELPVVDGFLSGLRCDDSASNMPSTVDLANRTANIELDPGETVTCTFTNSELDVIIIEKVTKPAGGVNFGFTSNISTLGTFTLDHGELASAGVLTGTYTITEAAPGPDRILTDISCDIFGPGLNDVTPVSGDLNTGSVSVPITEPGQAAFCVFTNEELGSITIVKEADPVDDTPFGFTITGGISDTFTLRDPSVISTTYSALSSGAYEVTELLPAGWDLDAIQCQHGPTSSVGIGYSENRAYIGLAAGDDIVCTFTNTKRGSITFVKQAQGGDGSFSYTSARLGSFRLTTSGGTAQRSFASLPVGQYNVSELPTKGWDLTNATCSDNSPVSAISLNAGESITCTFTNVKRGVLTVVKNATGGDGTFPFASTALGNFNLTTVNGTVQRSFTNLVPGSYDLSESVPAGWDLASAVCSDGSSLAGVAVAAGESVTCTFANVKRGSLTVIKQATGNDATFPFVSTALGNFSLATVNGTAQRTFGSLLPGSYDLSETVPASWRQESAVCSDGSTLPTVNVAPGEDVTCTFANTQLDTIVVVKVAVGGDATFAFTSQALGGFSLSTTNGQAQQSFSNLAPGSYSVAESATAGWTATVADPVCSNGDPASKITLGAGETVVCVFVNLKQDTIVVEKRTVGGEGSFAFSSNLPGAASFALTTTNGAASRSFTGLASGTYNIAETAPAGWVQTGASCDNGANPANISLAPGATVRCVFTNTQQSSLTVVKQATGGDGSFAFTSNVPGGPNFDLATTGGVAQQRFTGLAAGTYSISETVPAGWDLTRATCTDGSNPGAVDLAAGEDVTCVFANTQRGSLTVVKQTIGGDGVFSFASQALGGFAVATTNGSGQQVFGNLTPGVYDLSESAASGWSQGAATCSDGSNPASVTVEPGEDVTCTFANQKLDTILVQMIAVGGTCDNGDAPGNVTIDPGETVTCTFANAKLGSITIVKVAESGNDVFQFTSQALGNFSLTTLGSAFRGTAQRVFADLAPGSYDIQAPQPAGWVFVSASCSDNSDPASIVLDVAENVTCTYVSRPQPTALDEVEEPTLDERMFLPLINR